MATILLSYIINPLVILSISAINTVIFYIIFWKSYLRKRLIFVILLFIVCVFINTFVCVLIANNPIVICSSEYSEYIDAKERKQIQNDVKSLYKEKGFLFPAIIEVKYADNKSINLHIQYLFYGTVDFSIDAHQTKSIDKPLY